MKAVILVLAIYLVGAIIVYLLFRKHAKKEVSQRTIADRVKDIKSSFFSWIGVLAAMIMMYEDNKSKPAKW